MPKYLRAPALLAAMLAFAAGPAMARTPNARRASHMHHAAGGGSRLPIKAIERTLQVKGSMINGVLSIGVDRNDITGVTLGGVPILPSFQINGDFDFQALGKGKVLMNGDFPFKTTEINGAIDAMLAHGIHVEALHQHMYDFSPQVYFMHMKAVGDPIQIAAGLHAMMQATSVPLPQAPPANPTTPLKPNRLKRILHGYDAEVGSNGVVTVYIARRNPVTIDGIHTNPATNIAANVSFEPLNSAATQVAVVPDFAMTNHEINPVFTVMRAQGWDIGCLYNQETGEHPQLYFSHQFKVGDPYVLAQEVRNGLNQTNSH